MTTGSALPTLPQSVSRGRRISWLHWFASATACQVACPPARIGLGTPQPSGTFTSGLSTDRSPSPSLDITTTVTGLLLLAGLSPAGMAASFAARPFCPASSAYCQGFSILDCSAIPLFTISRGSENLLGAWLTRFGAAAYIAPT